MGLLASQFCHSARMRRGALLCACAAGALFALPVPAAPPIQPRGGSGPAGSPGVKVPNLLGRHDPRIGRDGLPGFSPGSLTVRSGAFDIAVEIPSVPPGKPDRSAPKQAQEPARLIPPSIQQSHADVEQLLSRHLRRRRRIRPALRTAPSSFPPAPALPPRTIRTGAVRPAMATEMVRRRMRDPRATRASATGMARRRMRDPRAILATATGMARRPTPGLRAILATAMEMVRRRMQVRRATPATVTGMARRRMLGRLAIPEVTAARPTAFRRAIRARWATAIPATETTGIRVSKGIQAV